MDTAKSRVRASPKPVNVFYVWYTELCRRMNCVPAPVVKPAKPKCQTILEFVADRLKVEEWNPIINALRLDTSLHVIRVKSRIGSCQFLHDIDTEDKARSMKRRFGSLWTAYILRQLTKSISTSLRSTEVLTCLELDGLPMFSQYLELLLLGLKKNKTLKNLSFTNCSIQDIGCQMVCGQLRFTPNVEVLNMSGCGLSSEGGEHLAKLIKYQQINRYCESWHNSLRYENPQSEAMRGIKRITLNCNPEFGDLGLNCILDELEDDLWIKALDLQKCGLTENLAPKIIDVLQYNRSLEIMDLRQNDLLHMSSVEKVVQVLREKQQYGYQPEYQWCNTALSLTWNSEQDSSSKMSFGTNSLHKSMSAPMKNMASKSSTFTLERTIRKSKTVDNVQRQNSVTIEKNYMYQCDSKVQELSTKLNSEIQKRREIERKNEELKQKLELIKSTVKLQNEADSKRNMKTVVSCLGMKPSKARFADKKSTAVKYVDNQELIKSRGKNVAKNGFKKPKIPYEKKNGFKNPASSNGINTNGFKNGISHNIINSACKIFESLLKTDNRVEPNMVEENILDYFSDEKNSTDTLIGANESDDYSGSQGSLFQFMEDMKNGFITPVPTTCTKYVIKENKKR